MAGLATAACVHAAANAWSRRRVLAGLAAATVCVQPRVLAAAAAQLVRFIGDGILCVPMSRACSSGAAHNMFAEMSKKCEGQSRIVAGCKQK